MRVASRSTKASVVIVAGAVLAGAVLVGAVQGLLWARIAPGEQYVVAADGRFGGLPTASYHQFAAVAIFVLAGICVGTGIAAAVWQWRSIRGVATLATVVGANAVGALTAYLVGRSLAAGVSPASVGAAAVQTVVTAPPTSGNALVLVAQPAVAVAVYTFLVAWNGRPDLARSEKFRF